MKTFVTNILISLWFAFSCSVGWAQGVYVTKNKNGTVFSDKPQPGSKEVKLPPLSVVPASPALPSAAEKTVPVAQDSLQREKEEKQEMSPVYRSFSIVSPQDNSSVAGGSSLFEIRLMVDPPLALGEGHAFVVRINGQFVEQRFTTTEFIVPPRFWEDGYLPIDQSMQIEASIVDGAEQVVMRAAPITFHTRQLLIQREAYPRHPAYAPGHPHPPKRPQAGSRPPKPDREGGKLSAKPKATKASPLGTDKNERGKPQRN